MREVGDLGCLTLIVPIPLAAIATSLLAKKYKLNGASLLALGWILVFLAGLMFLILVPGMLGDSLPNDKDAHDFQNNVLPWFVGGSICPAGIGIGVIYGASGLSKPPPDDGVPK